MTNGVSGNVRLLLRLEGLAIFLLSAFIYGLAIRKWFLFGLFFFAPDISFAGYLAGPKVGAIVYNAIHSLIGPAITFVLALVLLNEMLLTTTLIWAAHIGFDRAVGYGLKYSAGFGFTHLGFIGRQDNV